jgi:hypothetical protein
MNKETQVGTSDDQQLSEIEAAKERLLKKVLEKLEQNPADGEVFAAAHSSHSSSSKHSSQTW